MSAFSEIKDVISFLQKSDNIEMVNKVIDVQSKIIDMQEELLSLREEINNLKNNKEIESKVKRHPNDTVITVEDDEKIMYCSKCWDDERKLIQVSKDNDYYECPKCDNRHYFHDTSSVRYYYDESSII